MSTNKIPADDSDSRDSVPEEDTNKIINEEYKTWKKNAPFLYDIVLSTALEWPTLTVQWLPDKTSSPDSEFTTHRMIIGTHTSHGVQNRLSLCHVQLPKEVKPNVKDYDEDSKEIGGYGAGQARKLPTVKLSIVQHINHPGEVNRARYQPQNPNVIATMCTNGNCLIWDRTKHPSIPVPGQVTPQIELKGHTKEGYGVSWSAHKSGQLATAAEDNTVRLWDITQYQGTYSQSRVLSPTRTYTHHSASVNDVEHHPLHPALIGSVSDDKTLQVLDTRTAYTEVSSVISSDTVHSDGINTLSFNPKSESIVATGSSDRRIGIWDLRNLNFPLHMLEHHHDAVTGLEWHPFETSILASASYDRRVNVWDLSRVGEEQKPEDAEDGPPELLFVHGGHTARVSDFSWNKTDPWIMCSAAEDNLIQVWKVADNLVGGGEEDEVRMDELEGGN